MISVVVPCYGSPGSIYPLYQKIREVCETHNFIYEVILVNDACPKGSWGEIEKLAKEVDAVKGVNLSRNFGQHSAITCGLSFAKGETIIIMDCDLQDDPKYIPDLMSKMGEGYQVVQARRILRNERWLKRIQSRVFYASLSFFLGVDLDYTVANYGAYSKKVTDNILKMGDRMRFFPYLVAWLGFKSTQINVIQQVRHEGRSNYTLGKSLSLALDIAVSSSGRPLYICAGFGAFTSCLTFFLGIVYALRYYLVGTAPSGWTTIIVCLLFSTGVIMLNMGIVGLYLIKVFEQTKRRPLYVVDEHIN